MSRTKTQKLILRKCVGCGKQTSMYIPITICKDCRKLIRGYLDARWIINNLANIQQVIKPENKK